jgi:ABC-type dipeptide/oligopeptide/nickel transport system permease component
MVTYIIVSIISGILFGILAVCRRDAPNDRILWFGVRFCR